MSFFHPKLRLLAGSLFLLTLAASPAIAQNRRGDMPPTGNNSGDNSNSQPGNYRYSPADKWVPLEAEKRTAVNADLQATVVALLALLALYHDAKQSHWNLRGPLYFPLHLALQEFAEYYLKYADILAERQRSIDRPVDGRTATIAQTANMPPFPAGTLADQEVLKIMTERIYTVATRVRARLKTTADNGDDVTFNKLQDLSYGLDHQVWQLRVHMQ